MNDEFFSAFLLNSYSIDNRGVIIDTVDARLKRKRRSVQVAV